MSTILNDLYSQTETDRSQHLRLFLHGLGDGTPLLWPEQLAMRLNALDELDGIIGDFDPSVLTAWFDPELIPRANALRHRFEVANEVLYEAARAEIALQGSSPEMACWLMDLAKDR